MRHRQILPIECNVIVMNWAKLNFNKEIICWTILILFSLFCTLKMAHFCLSGEILNPDVSLYLISALKYAGIDYFNIARPEDLYYTPVISFLTSLIFRLGFVDKAAIIIVTSILCFLSYIGLYLFLKIRFNPLLSLAGVVIYGSTSVVIFNLCKGLIDIPSLSISIWALYFGILAIDKNPKYFLISFPLLVIGFFTKYTAGFILPVILLYYLMNREFIDNLYELFSDRTLLKSKIKDYLSSIEFKYIAISIMVSLILTIIICKTLILDFGGHLSFFQQSVNTFNMPNSDNAASVMISDKSYYLDSFQYILYYRQTLGPLFSNLLYGIFGISIVITIIKLIRNGKEENSASGLLKTRQYQISIILFVILLIGSFIGFKILENNMISNICFLGSVIFLHHILKNYIDEECLSSTLLYFAFFITYFIFISLYSVKTLRYALPLVMAFICIVVWSLDTIFTSLTYGLDGVKCKFKIDYSKLSNIILVILIVMFLVSTIAYIAPMKYEKSNTLYQEVLYKGYSNDLFDACNYIKDTDSDYHSKTFASFQHSSRTIRWYLNENVTVIQEKDPDLINFDNATYLILYENRTLNNYHLLRNCGDFNIYYHN